VAETTSVDTRYFTNLYLQDRGDTEVRTLTDLYTKANFWSDPAFPDRKSGLMTSDKDSHSQQRGCAAKQVRDPDDRVSVLRQE